MAPYTSLSVLVAATLAACSDAGPVSQPVSATDKAVTTTERVVIEATQQTLRVTNNTQSPIFYHLLENEFRTLYLPGPPHPTTTPRVDPGTVKTIAYEDILGYGPNASEAVFSWGHLLPVTDGAFDPGRGFVFDSLRGILIKL